MESVIIYFEKSWHLVTWSASIPIANLCHLIMLVRGVVCAFKCLWILPAAATASGSVVDGCGWAHLHFVAVIMHIELKWKSNDIINPTGQIRFCVLSNLQYSPCQTSSSNGKEAPTPASTVNVRKGRSRSKRIARCLQGSHQPLKGQWSLSVAGSCGRILSKTCENVVNLFCFGHKSDQPAGSLFVEWIAPQETRA